MTVEKQLGEFAAHLVREVDEAGLDVLITRVFPQIDHLSVSDIAQSALGSYFDRDPAVRKEPGGLAVAQQSTSWLRDDIPGQFKLALARALAGDPASARRAAEIAELLNEGAQAAWWWLRAAALGDIVARDYVQELHIRAQDAEPPVLLPRAPSNSTAGHAVAEEAAGVSAVPPGADPNNPTERQTDEGGKSSEIHGPGHGPRGHASTGTAPRAAR